MGWQLGAIEFATRKAGSPTAWPLPSIGALEGEGMEEKKDFDIWWGRRHGFGKGVHTPYAIYKKLHQAGADFEYIDFLQSVFRSGYMGRKIAKERIDNEIKKLKNADSPSSATDYRQWSMLKRQMLFDSIQETPSKPPHYHYKTVRKWVKDSIGPVIKDYFVKTGILLEGVEREKLIDRMASNLSASHKKQQKKAAKEKVGLTSEDPVITVYLDYCYNDLFRDPHKTGKKGDRWGTFFMLGVTEHLRQKSHGKPYYPLAVRLLRNTYATLNEPMENPLTDRNAMMRIRDLKKSRLNKWKRDLKILEKQLYPKYRHFHESWCHPDFVLPRQVNN